jgi:hypothetical protein
MFIPTEVLDQFALVRSVLHNDVLEIFFEAQQERANKFKRLFVTSGEACLVLICLLLILLSWRLSFASLSVSFPLWVDYLAAIIGLIALGLQLLISVSRAHSKWLYARFVAELTRQWKYQTFLDGEFVSKLGDSLEQFSKELGERWVLFKQRFRHGLGGMTEFIEESPFEFLVGPSSYVHQDVFDAAKRAYQLFRLDVQTAHLADKNVGLRALDRWTDALAKISLVASGLIAILDACLWGSHAMGWIDIHVGKNLTVLTAILAGSSLSFAIISAGTRVFRSASAITEERERYRFKELHLRRVEERLKYENDPVSILALMKEAETICTEELQEFLRSLSHANYFL